jgi:hypothetical protein
MGQNDNSSGATVSERKLLLLGGEVAFAGADLEVFF